MAQRRFAVPSTHMRIRFANCLRAARETFIVLVYAHLVCKPFASGSRNIHCARVYEVVITLSWILYQCSHIGSNSIVSVLSSGPCFGGCFSIHILQILVPVTGMMESVKYIKTVESRVMPLIKKLWPIGDEVFQVLAIDIVFEFKDFLKEIWRTIGEFVLCRFFEGNSKDHNWRSCEASVNPNYLQNNILISWQVSVISLLPKWPYFRFF